MATRNRREGIDVRVLAADPPQRAILDAKLADAFALLRTFGARHLDRARAHIDGILLLELGGNDGVWKQHARLICLNQDFVLSSETKAVHVASTVVHEVTHAWLDSRGFSYAPESRARIEAVCYRAEAAFLRRVPGCEGLAADHDLVVQAVSEGIDLWSDARLRAHALSDLEKLGAPAWLLRILSHWPRLAD